MWRSIQSEYRIDDAPGRATLLQICEAADTVQMCSVSRDGPLVKAAKGGGYRDHPLLKIQLAARSFIVRSLHTRLGLEAEPTRGVGRPPGTFNPTR